RMVELGSGAGFIKELFPGVVCSDVLPLSHLDFVGDGLALPLKNGTIRRFLMIDVFHHVDDPLRFLREMERCLAPGGSIAMVEPANTAWGRFIWKNFHHEDFFPDAPDWRMEQRSPLATANGAMPWIVFQRDRQLFLNRFPALEIEEFYAHTPLGYLCSGGFSCPQLIPDFLVKPLIRLDAFFSRLSPHLGMFYFIGLRKRKL
ncbi:MAG: methyltransferase domain-containing protein, partial [Candidatus Omnitrophota bacterium]